MILYIHLIHILLIFDGNSNKYENNPVLYGEEENQLKKYVVPNFKENVNFESL